MGEQKKKLYRSRKERVIAGVAGGLGEYLDIDPILIRIGFVLLTLINGIGILLYIVSIILIPLEPEEEKIPIKTEEKVQEFTQQVKERAASLADEFKEEIEKVKSEKWWSEKRNIIGLVIIIVGIIFLLEQMIPIHLLRWKLLWPIALILLGLYIIFKRKGK